MSTTTKGLEDMDFLTQLTRPIFRSYYDLIRYISLKKCRKMSTTETSLESHHISIARMVSDTAYTGDRVYRILNWLQSKNAIEICDEHLECFGVTCESFDNALVDIRKFIL